MVSGCSIIAQELQRLRCMIDDDPQLFTAEVIHRMMLTYRDIQVHNRHYVIVTLGIGGVCNMGYWEGV